MVRRKPWNLSLILLIITPAGAFAQTKQVDNSDWSPGSSSVAEIEQIPLGFRGKWAPTIANCSDQDGVEHMNVYSNGIDFYESGGRLERITQAGQDRTVLMKLSFEGEGGFWDKIWKAALGESGKSVVISLEDGSSAETYQKCP